MTNLWLKKVSAALLISVSLLSASACDGGGGTIKPEKPTLSPSPSGDKSGIPILTFGIIYPMAHPFYELITNYAEKEAEPSNIRLVVKAPDEANLEQQIRMMETMIKQKVDAIAIDPVDSVAIVPVINKAVENGIPVICFESDAPTSKRVGYIGTDQKLAGIQMGKVLEQQLQGRGMVLVETGMSHMRSLQLRLEGLLSYLNANTDIQVLEVRYNEGSNTKALSDLEEMIDLHPHFDAFVGLDVVSGPLSVLVWKAQGLNRYAFTFGVTEEIREALSNGQLTAAISLNEAEMSKRMIGRMIDAVQGKSVPQIDDTGLSVTTRRL
ncbi:sugar ABC transporter substrate-binding protein [Cohnella lupini]|uniref:Monosaccharide ABC transporter substrate-binding protein (CUT2 family) n=1 Tax=Cohnella lupini TaxID=1294267 RepID=A0A3D9HZL8_9BACL|nr:substrate-binding domain-containing protein [Cohnella lupini]RED54934.1 monosaccharide ABC transporter substrate-binding protein (CUT2 family) [Cohnella lupini]